MGAGCSQSGHAAVAVASASFGADAHTSDESVACGRIERRPATQEGAVAAGGPPGNGVVEAGSLGQSTTARLARLTGSTDAEDPGSDAPTGTGSGEASGDAATNDTSRSWSAYGAGIRVGDWNSRTLSLR